MGVSRCIIVPRAGVPGDRLDTILQKFQKPAPD